VNDLKPLWATVIIPYRFLSTVKRIKGTNPYELVLPIQTLPRCNKLDPVFFHEASSPSESTEELLLLVGMKAVNSKLVDHAFSLSSTLVHLDSLAVTIEDLLIVSQSEPRSRRQMHVTLKNFRLLSH